MFSAVNGGSLKGNYVEELESGLPVRYTPLDPLYPFAVENSTRPLFASSTWIFRGGWNDFEARSYCPWPEGGERASEVFFKYFIDTYLSHLYNLGPLGD